MTKEVLEKDKIKSIIESLLFINERPLEIGEICEVVEIDKKKVKTALDELIKDNDKRGGICVVEVAGGYQMCSVPQNEVWVKKMYQQRTKQKLSIASLETLAIIAYKQPATRIEIESIRGVNVDGVVRHLLDLGLIKTGGRKEVVGKPFLYITTRKFLEYFGLNNLKDLPKMEEFAALAATDKVVQEMMGEPGQETGTQPAKDPDDKNEDINHNVAEEKQQCNAEEVKE